MDDSEVSTPAASPASAASPDVPAPAAPAVLRPVARPPAATSPGAPKPQGSAPQSPSGPQLKTSLEMVVSHWNQPVAGLFIDASDFYRELETGIRALNIPDIEYSRVLWKEGQIGSASREYLRITRRRMVYDICCAPFGAGSFVSSWLCIVPFELSLCHLTGIFITMIITSFTVFLVPVTLLALAWSAFIWSLTGKKFTTTSAGSDIALGLTALGPLVKWFGHRKPTYYQLDSAGVFQTAVQEVVVAAVKGQCETRNVRPPAELTDRPVLRDFMKR